MKLHATPHAVAGRPAGGNTLRRLSFSQSAPLLGVAVAVFACGTSYGAEPRVFQLGGLDVTPTLTATLDRDDNIYRREVDEQDSLITLLTPRLGAAYTNGVNGFQVNLEATRGDFEATSADDFTTWLLDGTAHLELNDFNLLDLSAGFEDGIQRRGTGFSQFGPLPDEPDAFDRSTLGLTYQLGSQNSRARLRVGGNLASMEYTNNQEFASGRDYDQTGLQSTLLFRVSSRTDILLEARTAEFDYDQPLTAGGQPSASLDSDEQYVFIGASWEATARTTGSVRVGRARKDFASATRQDVDGPSYEIGVQYAPLSYSTFELNAQRNYGEGIGVGNATERTVVGLNWRHNWRDSLSSEVSLAREDSDYVGSALTDKVSRVSARVNYEFARWLDLNIGFRLEDRDTNVTQAFGYDQSVVSVGFQASF